MIADSHLHLFPHGYPSSRAAPILQGRTEVDAYEHLMARHSVQAGLVVCYEADGIDPANNAYVRELARTRPWLNSVAYVDAGRSPSVEEMEKLLAAGHVGVALYLPDDAAARTVSAWPSGIWAGLDRRRAVISLNARPEAIAGLAPLVERAENCSFLFSHLGLPGRHAAPPSPREAAGRLAPLLALARLPNVGVKVSGLYAIDPLPPHRTAHPFIELVLETFQPSNLHWGSDFSPALEFVAFEDAMTIPGLGALPRTSRDLILGDGLLAKIRRVGT